jgi:hypothetical protein
METDQVDVLALAVFCYLEQIENAEKAGRKCKLGRDVRKADGVDGVDFNFARIHAISCSHSHVWTRPDANAAGDFAATHALAKALGKHHAESLPGSILILERSLRRQDGSLANIRMEVNLVVDT